ncbi:PEGA domain-containing protein [Oceaniferula spumae]
MKIVSDPTGASVFLDDKFVGVTPLRTMPLSTGVLRLELAGFKTIITRVADHAEGESKVQILDFNLEMLPRKPQ